MCSFENKWLKDSLYGLKSFFYRRYVEDIFVLFYSLDHAETFEQYLSSKHPNINFSLEKENDGCFGHIFREKEKFVINVYWKKTFTCVYTNFNSFTPETYGLIKSLLLRCFGLFSDFVKFHYEINIIKTILNRISYLRDFVDKCIKDVLDRV